MDVLHEAAQRILRRNAFLSLQQHARAMPRGVFHAILAVLLAFRLLCIVTVVLAWKGTFLDSRYWATGAEAHSDYLTPFHHHPNLFGWRFGFQGFVQMHN